MEFKRNCPTCHQDMEIDEALLSSTVICPHCSASVPAPGADEPKRFDFQHGTATTGPESLATSAGRMAGYMGFGVDDDSPIAEVRSKSNFFWLRCGVSLFGSLATLQAFAVLCLMPNVATFLRAGAWWIGWRAAVLAIDAADCLVKLATREDEK